MEAKIKLPIMIAVDDYHEFPFLQRTLQKVMEDNEILVEELEESCDIFGEDTDGNPDINCYYCYGVIYKDRFPSIETMKELSKNIRYMN